MGAQQRAGNRRARRVHQGRPQRRRSRRARGDEQQLPGARAASRARPSARAPALPPSSARVSGVSRTTRVGSIEPRARLVERHVSVRAEAEHGEVERRLVEQRLVARRLGHEVLRGSVESVQARRARCLGARAPAPPARLRASSGADADYSSSCRTVASGARQLAAAGVRSQRCVHPRRRPVPGQQQPEPGPRPHPVGDHLGRRVGDSFLVGEHQRRGNGQHPANASESCGSPRIACAGSPRWRVPARGSDSIA